MVEGGEGGGFKNPLSGGHHGAAPAGGVEDRSAHRGRRRLPGRPDHGRRPGPGSRGHPAGHPHGVGRRVAHPPQLEAGHPRRGRDRHRLPQPARLARPAGPAHRVHQRARSSTTSRTPSPASAMPTPSTSRATCRPASPCRGRWPVASRRSGRWPTSSMGAPASAWPPSRPSTRGTRAPSAAERSGAARSDPLGCRRRSGGLSPDPAIGTGPRRGGGRSRRPRCRCGTTWGPGPAPPPPGCRWTCP